VKLIYAFSRPSLRGTKQSLRRTIIYPQTLIFIDLHSLGIASYLARTGELTGPDDASLVNHLYGLPIEMGIKKTLFAQQRGMSSEAMTG
jgi:hypothetical protein